ncbi:MAG: hypothetical protein CMH58_10125 [Myxococcales bacterium]|nr:hypothetical protein [Myxococcales bacterium]
MVDFVEFIDEESENPTLPLKASESRGSGTGKKVRGTPRILVIGTGGAGGNVVTTLHGMGLQGADLAATNTDAQDLEACPVGQKILLGADICRGEGTGGIAEHGHLAVMESVDAVQALVAGTDMVFVVLGGGGGTGSGSAPEICHIARSSGALTVAVMTKPFAWEGRKRMRTASEACDALRNTADATVVLSNDKLQSLCDEDASVEEGYEATDRLLAETVKGLVHLAQAPASGSRSINLDFRDVRTVLAARRDALIGIGLAKGPDRAEKAFELAISSPLLEDATLEGATGVLCHIRYGSEALTMREKARIGALIGDVIDEDADYILGFCSDDSLTDEISVMVVATGFDGGVVEKRVADRSDGVRVMAPQSRATGIVDRRMPAPEPQIETRRVAPRPVVSHPTPVGRRQLKKAGVRPSASQGELLIPSAGGLSPTAPASSPSRTSDQMVARGERLTPEMTPIQPSLPEVAATPASLSAAEQRAAEGQRAPKVRIGAVVYDEEPAVAEPAAAEPSLDGEPSALYVENLTSILPTHRQAADLYAEEPIEGEPSRAPFSVPTSDSLQRNSTLRGAQLTPTAGGEPIHLESPQQASLVVTDDDIDRPPFLK